MKKIILLFTLICILTSCGNNDSVISMDDDVNKLEKDLINNNVIMNENGRIHLEGTNIDVAKWIWNSLVPAEGQSNILQGEILRVIEGLRYEAQNNGNINWDEGFKMYIDLLKIHLGGEENFSEDTKKIILSDIKRLEEFIRVDELTDNNENMLPYIEDDLYDRLTVNLVEYCKIYPEFIKYEGNPKQFR